MNIEGKVFVITGAARGLGLAICQAITSKGGSCALVDLDQAANLAQNESLTTEGFQRV
jgi:3-oxoacyl-[acyl-carrier protein] reductase